VDVLSAVSLLGNGLTLALAFSVLFVILWNDSRKERNQFFAVFLILVLVWNGGALIAQSVALIDPFSPLLRPAVGLMEFGFVGSSVGLYVLSAVLVNSGTRRFRALALSSLALVLTFRLLLLLNDAPILFEMPRGGSPIYRAQPFQTLFFIIFDGAALYLIWRYRRKVRSRGMLIGIVLFVFGQTLGFINPALQSFSLSLIVCAAAALILSFALLRQEIFLPLAQRNSQVEALRRLSGAIAGQTALDQVLHQIALQTAALLDGDGVVIWLKEGARLRAAAGCQLPPQYLGLETRLGDGIAGTVAQTLQSIRIDDYRRDWRGADELPLARERFGAVMCAPLIYAHEAIGALMVIAGRQGRLFEREQVYTLEVLSAQAAVAIAHSKLFEEQRALTAQIESARAQLETVLSSTESPVIAVDRRFKLIFANPAARALFDLRDDSKSIFDLLPANALPKNGFAALRALRRRHAYAYEIQMHDRVFSCHLAQYGTKRIGGWVAVLTDITQLMELDRLKSEMVRMTSHDLKNPLQAALANLELLRDDLVELENPEIVKSVDTIERQLERMYRIISGILDMERLRAETKYVEQAHPEQIVERAVQEVRDFAVERRILLDYAVSGDLPCLACDTDQLNRALINLIENAIKFTPAGGCVQVCAERSHDEIVFSVSDTGVGIPEEMQPRVFDRFFRGNQRGVEHVSGSGLGLSLVKAVVENHRGRVWLQSVVGQGTTFYVAIPIAAGGSASRS
jgi:two-component system phosphate regulon sensor histidine kinase PhoR